MPRRISSDSDAAYGGLYAFPVGRFVLLGALIAMLCGLFAPAASAQDEGWAPPTSVWVEDTGQIVDQTFLDTWRANQILIGDPVSDEMSARVKLDGVPTKKRTIQYFENVALVSTYDDERGDDWNVRALPLGEAAFELDQKKLENENVPATGNCDGFTDDECISFKSTRHTVKLGFKGYWEANRGEQFLGAPLTEEFVTRKGVTTQYFENGVLQWTEEDGILPRALGAEMAKRDKVGTKAVSRPDDVPTYSESIFYEPVVITTPVGPGPQQGAYKEIVVSISQQYMWVYEGDALISETYVSTGTAEVPAVTTPTGFFTIHTKLDSQTMEGTISNEYYRVDDVPWVMYFDYEGNAIHGAYWHNNFGTPMSHGCVNLPLWQAEFLYRWAEIGTAVSVIG